MWDNPSPSRREFLRQGAFAVGAGLTAWPSGSGAATTLPATAQRGIVLFLVGGPSHIDTWDPKPHAPAEVRGPFSTIRTATVGIHLSECFPRLAQRTQRVTFLRSLHHTSAPIHETGQQMLQTGLLYRDEAERPNLGAWVAMRRGGPAGLAGAYPRNVLLPGPIVSTGVSVSHGQGGGDLPACYAPTVPTLELQRRELATEGERSRQRYGQTPFGDACLLARRAVEAGSSFVTVNMFSTVFDCVSWDCHADGGSLATTLSDYRTTVAPMFDWAYSALLDDLSDRGLLDSTLVVAVGEFGRTPYLNPRGGRDHWPGVWTALVAGGGVPGGQLIGRSDSLGAEPADRPITPSDLAAAVLRTLGVSPQEAGLPDSDVLANWIA